jgi:hypothetical protein
MSRQEAAALPGRLCPAHSDKRSNDDKQDSPVEQQQQQQQQSSITEQITPYRACDTPYVSRARVLLVGTGADEQMAGYSRHRSVYRAHGYSRMRSELALDMGRLWQRNLVRLRIFSCVYEFPIYLLVKGRSLRLSQEGSPK